MFSISLWAEHWGEGPSLEYAVAYCSRGSGHAGGENRERARLARLYLGRVIGAVGEQPIGERKRLDFYAQWKAGIPSNGGTRLLIFSYR